MEKDSHALKIKDAESERSSHLKSITITMFHTLTHLDLSV
jgi:hypothetical protein